MELDGTVNTVVYCDFLWVHGKSWPPVWKEHELVCEVERYQLETADFTSSQLGGSETRPWNGAGTCSNPGKQFGNWRGGRSVLLYLWLLRWRISGLMASGWPLLSADDLFLLAWSDDNIQLEWLTAQLEATQMKTSTSKSEAMVLCKKKKKWQSARWLEGSSYSKGRNFSGSHKWEDWHRLVQSWVWKQICWFTNRPTFYPRALVKGSL